MPSVRASVTQLFIALGFLASACSSSIELDSMNRTDPVDAAVDRERVAGGGGAGPGYEAPPETDPDGGAPVSVTVLAGPAQGSVPIWPGHR